MGHVPPGFRRGFLVLTPRGKNGPPKRVYDPRIFEGRVMLPEEQEWVYNELLEFERIEYINPSMRELILDVWPDLECKLPPDDAAPPEG
jgi:hypothetical protein